MSERSQPFRERLDTLLRRLQPDRTPAWLAKKSGLSPAAISRYLKGDRNPTLSAAECLAPVLGVTLEELLAGTDAEERLSEVRDVVPRTQYEEAVLMLGRYESRIADLERRVRAEIEAAAQERERRDEADRAARTAHINLERRERDYLDLHNRYRDLEAELRHHKEVWADAKARIASLQQQLRDVATDAKSGAKSGKLNTALASLGALASIVTVATIFGGGDKDEKE